MNKPEIVVVTGASAGVGRAVVREFAKSGAWIGLLARNPERLEAAREEVICAGGKAVAIPTDVTDPGGVDAAAEQVEEQLGPIDVWVNGAMATIFSPFLEITPEEYKRATEVTYLGVVHGTMAGLKRMVPRNKGAVVQIGSALSYRAIPLQSAYCGAKFAIRGFTDSVRTELMHQKSDVHITMVQLPAVNTPQFSWSAAHVEKHPRPVAPVYEPEVAARAVYWAAHHLRREVYVGVSSVATILGAKLAPGLLDRYLARSAWSGQMTPDRIRPDRPNNLYHTVDGGYEAHGEFGNEALSRSPQLWASMNKKWFLAALSASLLAVVLKKATA